jgi:hypothetical protein
VKPRSSHRPPRRRLAFGGEDRNSPLN